MKFRTDFVTNSSSSSFIYAVEGEIDDKTKMALANVVIENILGEKVLSKDATEEQINRYIEDRYMSKDSQEAIDIKNAIKSGKDIYSGFINYENCEYRYGELFEKFFKTLEKVKSDKFKSIAIDFGY